MVMIRSQDAGRASLLLAIPYLFRAEKDETLTRLAVCPAGVSATATPHYYGVKVYGRRCSESDRIQQPSPTRANVHTTQFRKQKGHRDYHESSRDNCAIPRPAP